MLIFAFLLAEFLFDKLFPDWNFRTAFLIKSNRVLVLSAFVGLLFCVLFLFKVDSYLIFFWGITLFFLLVISSWLIINPILSYTFPVDKLTLYVFSDGKKFVVRQYKNAKTNREIQDTVLVKDFFIFRQQFDRSK